MFRLSSPLSLSLARTQSAMVNVAPYNTKQVKGRWVGCFPVLFSRSGDVDRARRFTDGLADKAKRLILTQEQLTQAYKETDRDAMSKVNKQLLQNLSFGG